MYRHSLSADKGISDTTNKIPDNEAIYRHLHQPLSQMQTTIKFARFNIIKRPMAESAQPTITHGERIQAGTNLSARS